MMLPLRCEGSLSCATSGAYGRLVEVVSALPAVVVPFCRSSPAST